MPLPVASTIIAVNTNRVQNSGGAATDLLSVRLPPGLLRNVGDCIRISAAFFLAANANSKTNNVFFGSTTIGGRTAADNALPRFNECWVYKRGSNQQGAILLDHCNGQASLTILTDSLTEDEQSPILIKTTAQGVADGDVISRLLMVEYIPATSVFGF